MKLFAIDNSQKEWIVLGEEPLLSLNFEYAPIEYLESEVYFTPSDFYEELRDFSEYCRSLLGESSKADIYIEIPLYEENYLHYYSFCYYRVVLEKEDVDNLVTVKLFCWSDISQNICDREPETLVTFEEISLTNIIKEIDSFFRESMDE